MLLCIPGLLHNPPTIFFCAQDLNFAIVRQDRRCGPRRARHCGQGAKIAVEHFDLNLFLRFSFLGLGQFPVYGRSVTLMNHANSKVFRRRRHAHEGEGTIERQPPLQFQPRAVHSQFMPYMHQRAVLADGPKILM